MTEAEAKVRLKELLKEYSAVEQKMVDLALKYNLDLSLGDYGSGRTLLLSDDKYSGKERGDWLMSSETC